MAFEIMYKDMAKKIFEFYYLDLRKTSKMGKRGYAAIPLSKNKALKYLLVGDQVIIL